MAHSSARVVALIIDQDARNRSLYAAHLALHGYVIDEASDGRDALVKALITEPAVIVTEADLPGIDGYHLCELLRRDHDTCEIPIVLMTGGAAPTASEIASATSADAVLVKPCSPELLLAEIRRVLGRHGRPDDELTPETVGNTTHRRSEPIVSHHVAPHAPLSHQYGRYATRKPPLAPQPLICPECVWDLDYDRSYVGGVSATNTEQWDYFKCPGGCGTFQYRHRTKKLRRIG